MQENTLLSTLRAMFARPDPTVIAGSGPDDCAHVGLHGCQLALSTDAFAENSHFTSADSPEDVAYKCLAASLSDLAASGCQPRWALVSLCLRPGLPPEWSARFAESLAQTASQYGTTIIGGDTIAATGVVVVSVTVIGDPMPGGPILRAGAKPGDVLVVTGALGGSLLGKHLCPLPRFKEMEYCLAVCRELGVVPSAALDISDGLALDLSRLCQESAVGAVIEETCIPVADAARQRSASTGKTALVHALSDGEDFELLTALPPAAWDALQARTAPPGLAAFTRIGTVRKEPGIMLTSASGVTSVLDAQGYQHQW